MAMLASWFDESLDQDSAASNVATTSPNDSPLASVRRVGAGKLVAHQVVVQRRVVVLDLEAEDVRAQHPDGGEQGIGAHDAVMLGGDLRDLGDEKSLLSVEEIDGRRLPDVQLLLEALHNELLRGNGSVG